MNDDPEDWASIPTKTAWLIEWPASDRRPIQYFAWPSLVMDAADAVRFCRKQDAAAVCKLLRVETAARPVEHQWLTAIADTHAKRGDVKQAPSLMSGGGAASQQSPNPRSRP